MDIIIIIIIVIIIISYYQLFPSLLAPFHSPVALALVVTHFSFTLYIIFQNQQTANNRRSAVLEVGRICVCTSCFYIVSPLFCPNSVGMHWERLGGWGLGWGGLNSGPETKVGHRNVSQPLGRNKTPDKYPLLLKIISFALPLTHSAHHPLLHASLLTKKLKLYISKDCNSCEQPYPFNIRCL